jgi:hypothetical protein
MQWLDMAWAPHGPARAAKKSSPKTPGAPGYSCEVILPGRGRTTMGQCNVAAGHVTDRCEESVGSVLSFG